MIASNSHLANLGCRLSGNDLPFKTGSRVSEPVKTAPVVPPPATGAGNFLQDGEAASRLVHTQEIAGASPAPATSSVRQTRPGRSAPAVRASDESTASHPVAKASEDNGRIDAAIGAPAAGEVSRGSDAADRQRSALPGFTGDDDGRDVEASGGTASVITIPQAVTAAETAPVAIPCPAGAVALSEASAFILSLVAAHEGRAREDILAQLIAAAADAIGIHSLIMRDAGDVDLADVPDFAVRAANRFRHPVLTAHGASPLPPDRAPEKACGLQSEPWQNDKKGGGP